MLVIKGRGAGPELKGQSLLSALSGPLTSKGHSKDHKWSSKEDAEPHGD